MVALPFVSVIIPCRNEARHIEACLDSVTQGTYPPDRMEILVVEGNSTDDTLAIVRRYADRHRVVRVLQNDRAATPVSLNLGIKEARGEVIVRLDAHATVRSDYLEQSVAALARYRAENVGGPMHTLPGSPTAVSQAIAIALSHPFGVGNSVFRTHAPEAREVDTVFGGCYPREVFKTVGPYNERLVRGQDMEFNLRLRKRGGRVMFVPQIVSYYYARATYGQFIRYAWVNGMWAIIPFALSDVVPVRPRHLAPLILLVLASGLGLLGMVNVIAWWVAGTLIVGYVVLAMAATVQRSARAGRASVALLLPVMFSTLHVLYGAGSVAGVARLLTMRESWKRVLSRIDSRATENSLGSAPR